MHDVDVRLILIVHFIQNHLVFIRKLIYFKIHGIVRWRQKVKTNHVEKHLGNSDTEDSRTKKKCLCFEVCALCLSSTIESSRLYMWQNLVESRWYPTASSAQICHLWTIGFASSNDHLSKLKLPAHNIKKYKKYKYI